MRNNGSPDPVFKTDEHSTYFLTTLSAIVSNQVSNQVKMLVFNDLENIIAYTNEVSDQVSKIILSSYRRICKGYYNEHRESSKV